MIEQISVSRKQLDSCTGPDRTRAGIQLLLDGYAACAWESYKTVRRGTTQNVTHFLSAGGQLEMPSPLT